MRRHIASLVRHKVSAPTFVLQITTTVMLVGYLLASIRDHNGNLALQETLLILLLLALGFSSGVMMMAYEKYSPKEDE